MYKQGTKAIYDSDILVEVIDWDRVTACYLVKFIQEPIHFDLVAPETLRKPCRIELLLLEEK